MSAEARPTAPPGALDARTIGASEGSVALRGGAWSTGRIVGAADPSDSGVGVGAGGIGATGIGVGGLGVGAAGCGAATAGFGAGRSSRATRTSNSSRDSHSDAPIISAAKAISAPNVVTAGCCRTYPPTPAVNHSGSVGFG